MSIVDNPLWQEYLDCCEENGTKPSLWDFINWKSIVEMTSKSEYIKVVEWVK